MAILSVNVTSFAWLLTLDLEFARIYSEQCDEAELAGLKALETGNWYSQVTPTASPGRNRNEERR